MSDPPRTPKACPRCGSRSFTMGGDTVWRDDAGVVRGDIHCLPCGELVADWAAYRVDCRREASILDARKPIVRPSRGPNR